MARHPVRRWKTGDPALLAGEPVTIAGFIDHGGPGPLDELLVELAGGAERTVHHNELTTRFDVIEGDRSTGEVYLAGGRLDPSESLAVAAHSPDEFGEPRREFRRPVWMSNTRSRTSRCDPASALLHLCRERNVPAVSGRSRRYQSSS